MILLINWAEFHLKYFKTATVFIYETDESWVFLTSDDRFKVKAVVMKDKEKPESNIMFVEHYLNGKDNLVKVVDIESDDSALATVKGPESEMLETENATQTPAQENPEAYNTEEVNEKIQGLIDNG